MISNATKIAILKTAPTLSHIELIELVERECELASQRTWIGLEQKDMPDGEDAMFDHPYFTAGMVYADKKLKEKNK